MMSEPVKARSWGKVHLGLGSVVKVVIHGDRTCAAKRLHEIFFEEENEGVDSMANAYLQECNLLRRLNHRNITKFIGIFFDPNARLPLLVMELLDTSLAKHLNNDSDANLSIVQKESILKDVAKGLAYLHGLQPAPVIHRDLTASNVLLNLGPPIIAKISDMGNSRIIDSKKIVNTLTKCPGARDYMPPEAVGGNTIHYGPSLDIFSFGHLALYTIIEHSPDKLLPATYQDSRLHARSEVDRRRDYFSKMETSIGADHPLIPLVKQCLRNIPDERPCAQELVRRLKKLEDGDSASLYPMEQSDNEQEECSGLQMTHDPIEVHSGRFSSVCVHPAKNLAVSVSGEAHTFGKKLYYSTYSTDKKSRSKVLTLAQEYDSGKQPSIALVQIKDITYAIVTLRNKFYKNFYYRIGVVDEARKTIDFQFTNRVSIGVKPKISANANGVVVIVYEEPYSFDKLRYHIGEIDISRPENLRIDWRFHDRISGLNGVEPDIAINGTKAVVICRTGAQTLLTVVGTIQPDCSSIEWGSAQILPSPGINPTIDINSHGYVVEMHQTKVLRRLKQCCGSILLNGTIEWKQVAFYTLGEYPTISINDENFVLEMHKTYFGFKLFQSQGILGKTAGGEKETAGGNGSDETEKDETDHVYPL